MHCINKKSGRILVCAFSKANGRSPTGVSLATVAKDAKSKMAVLETMTPSKMVTVVKDELNTYHSRSTSMTSFPRGWRCGGSRTQSPTPNPENNEDPPFDMKIGTHVESRS